MLNEYEANESVELKVQKLASNDVALPYGFYDVLDFCTPLEIVSKIENPGEIIFGDRIQNSLYDIKMMQPIECKRLPPNPAAGKCPTTYTNEMLSKFLDKIEKGYFAQMIIDNLPVALAQQPRECGKMTLTPTDPDNPKYYAIGYPIGCQWIEEETNKKRFVLNNHLAFTFRYHENDAPLDGALSTKYRLVGAEVVPMSINFKSDECNPTMPTSITPLFIDSGKDTAITWSYSVKWESSKVKWASRWDAYLQMGESDDAQVHWFSIINSLMIVLFLTGMVAMIMLRTLNKDFALYNQLDSTEEAQEETGWKLVHGEVFRAPPQPNLFSVYAGTGIQVNLMTLVTLSFAVLGFLSPANRGSIMTATLLLFVFSGAFAGYYSARLYKMFKGQYWKTNVAFTALFFPGVLFAIFFALNFLIFAFAHTSSGAVPFTTLLMLMAMWFGISAPLVVAGSYFGRRKEEIKNPVKTNLIPRRVPEQPWYMRPPFSVLMGGILPFGAVFIELFFILNSIWMHKFYYVFPFLFVVFVILVLTCAEITIVMIYFQLCSGDYRWWWRSFFTSGSSAMYLFLYSIFYYFTKLNRAHFLSGVLFFGYMTLISYFFFVLTGSIGFFACFWFTRKIYGAIKID